MWTRIEQWKSSVSIITTMRIFYKLLLGCTITTKQNTITPCWSSVFLRGVIIICVHIISICWIKIKLTFMECLQQGVFLSFAQQLIIPKKRSIVLHSNHISNVLVVTIDTIV